jgi:TfoX/Sxy family transcriptional regulator of competence genes
MAYSEELAERVRRVLLPYKKDIEEKKMMGGLTFMLKGRMCCGIMKDGLIVRVGSGKFNEVLAKPHARIMDFTGKPLKNFLYAGKDGIKTKKQLEEWVALGVEYVKALPQTARKKVQRKKK